ncbi:BTG domain-containing protein [Microbotryomycetes sp. JL201]|nr:BTG domain-containing protein [Microbotryomycetes sp. JL201]
MHAELAAVSAFLASFISSSDAQARFVDELVRLWAQKFAGHWHSSDPEQGSAYRAVVRNGAQIDAVVLQAARNACLSPRDVLDVLASAHGRLWLGERWTIWVDPGCVSLRVERTDGGARDPHFIELYGHLPLNIKVPGLALAALPVGASVNISGPPTSTASPLAATTQVPLDQDLALLSPVKRTSRAIQILPPPSRAPASTGLASLRPESPAAPAVAPPRLLASPFVIPPTPDRPGQLYVDAQNSMQANGSHGNDVFSPSPTPNSATSHCFLRSPSPLASQLSSLSPTDQFAHHLRRRSSSRSSSHASSRSASVSGESSDGECSGSDSIFSAESLASSVTSAENAVMWKATSLDAAVLDAAEFGTHLPMRPPSASAFAFPMSNAHQRSHSSAENASLGLPLSPGKIVGHNVRSLPSSPTKPRRRGTRGGSGQGSQGGHEHTSSISSIRSIHSTASGTSTRSRTTEQVTEHSGGKVGVLGGGVLLGVANPKPTSGQRSGRSRDRRRGGQRQHNHGYSMMQPMPTYMPPLHGGWEAGM